ncbi:GNAT family N-acetyltransferase [Aurantiacibacter gilvus]|uniref:GNAT family N-acetyltransferase n=1 Tax=Aurantiacibacter gilvus TaxID=3139141 RepID=A0ABU9II20_9SPHN
MADFRRETERLVLRDWRDGDWEAQWRVTNTPTVMRWLGGVLDDEGIAKQIARVETCQANNGFCFWVVERKDDGGHLSGEMLGMCGLKRADAPGSSVTGTMEIGWRMREEAWGHGYAKEAAMAAMELGFTRFGADQIVALTVQGNEPSWGLMLRLGMTRRQDLDYEDTRYSAELNPTIVYAIAKDEWEQQAQ